jgi:DNA-binding GntR family transcriptional regulator
MSNLSEQISETLKKAILEQRLIPGAKLGERELSEIFEVSRIVVRQALIRLATDGLVTIERNRGAFVAKPSLQEALEIYDTLTLLEQGVAMQLSERLDSSGWDKLRAHVALQAEAIEKHDHKLADDLGQGFHTLFISLAGNRLLQDIHAQIVQRTSLLRSLYTSRFDYCNLLNEHAKVINLLERGRLKPAMELIDSHHRHVVRGYVLDTSEYPDISLREALAPDNAKESEAESFAAAGI